MKILDLEHLEPISELNQVEGGFFSWTEVMDKFIGRSTLVSTTRTFNQGRFGSYTESDEEKFTLSEADTGTHITSYRSTGLQVAFGGLPEMFTTFSF